MPTRRHFLASSLTALTAATAGVAIGRDKPAPIRVGQIGTGHAHASKIQVYRESPDYEFVGVVEPDDELRKQAQANPDYQGVTWMTQAELLNSPGVSAVLVETRVKDLLATAAAAIAAGKHIHLDKPAGEDLSHLRRILADADRQGLLVQMGYMYRYNPGIMLLRELLREGCLGDIFEVHTVMSKVVAAPERRRLAEFPGGIMFELGCHVLDLVIGILGNPDKVTAYPRHSSTLADGLLDNMLAVLEYPRATATIKSTALEVDGGSRRHLVVCGTKGTLIVEPLDNPAGRLTLSESFGPYRQGTHDITFPKYTRYIADAADMARILRGEKKSDFTSAHDLLVQTTLLQACGLPLPPADEKNSCACTTSNP